MTNKLSFVASLLLSPARMAGAFFMISAISVPALAAPEGGKVEIGEASIDVKDTHTIIEQKTDRLFLSWDSFDTKKDESVIFNQPDASSIAINKINGKSPTDFRGSLSANGKIVIINENGIVFGKSAQVDVGSLIATTVDVNRESFAKGKGDIEFLSAKDARHDGAVVNRGRISAVKGGMVALIGQTVRNTGLIEAHVGTVHLASGDAFVVDFVGDGLVSLALDHEAKKQLVDNKGVIDAAEGKIYFSVAGAEKIADGVINMDGKLAAQEVKVMNGKIKIDYIKDEKSVRDEKEEAAMAAIKHAEEEKEKLEMVVVAEPAVVEPEPEVAVVEPEPEVAVIEPSAGEPEVVVVPPAEEPEVVVAPPAEEPEVAVVKPVVEPEPEIVVAPPVEEPAEELVGDEPEVAVVIPDVIVPEPDVDDALPDLSDLLADLEEPEASVPDVDLAELDDDALGLNEMAPGGSAPVSKWKLFASKYQPLICNSFRCLPASVVSSAVVGKAVDKRKDLLADGL